MPANSGTPPAGSGSPLPVCLPSPLGFGHVLQAFGLGLRAHARQKWSISRDFADRGDWIRTSDRPAPSRVRYQTAPLPVAEERATGIEPALEAWKASVQPQHFARKPVVMLQALLACVGPPANVVGGPSRLGALAPELWEGPSMSWGMPL